MTIAILPRRLPRFIALISVALVGVVSSCGGGESVSLNAKAIDTGLAPKNNGFSFANFGAAASPEVFNATDLFTMFGAKACASGSGETCQPTAQAAAWAQMVNDARQSGHCEGLAVQASERFNIKANPPTVDLTNSGDVTHGIMRAFATQFLPEVQSATTQWAKKSLVEIVNELYASFKKGGVQYTLGLYTPTGGHAVLPYALEFPSKDLAVIKVYDSNWPGMERYVVVDLKAEQWYFSFSSTNPQKDECAWTGKAGDMDITPTSARTAGTCPFCGDGTKVTKSVLLIRSTSLNWSVKTKSGVYTPSAETSITDIDSRAIRTASCDNIVKLPEFVLSTDTADFELNLPDTASAYVSNGNSVIHIVTTGSKKRQPITFTQNSFSFNDASTTVQIAVDNLMAQVDTNGSEITINNNQVSIAVDGDASPVIVDSSNPQVVVTENDANALVVTKATNLVTVVPTVAKELVPESVKPGLSPAEDRSLTNDAYVKAVEEVPTTPITAPPVATTTTIKKVATTLPNGSSGIGDNSSTSIDPSISPGSTSSTTTTTSSTAPPQPVRILFNVYGSGWTPTVKIHTAQESWNQVDVSRMDPVCSSMSSCNGAEVNASYDDYFMLYVTTDQSGSYVGYGPTAGGSYVPGSLTFPPRRCNSSYNGYSGITCIVNLYKDMNALISH